MISKFQFLLDGNYVDDPKGWEDLDTTIKRAASLGAEGVTGLLILQEAQLEFYGNGYDYIKQQFDSLGFCDYIEIEIRQTCDQLNYDQIFKGVIYLSDCVFDLMRCSVKCKTVDDGFYARINNNKSIKAKLDVGTGKNNTTITAAQDIEVEFFNPTTGTYSSGLYDVKPHCFTIYEVFKFLIAFMSDGTIDFVSDDFNIGGQWEGQCLTIGNEVRLGDQSVIPMLSFQEVFTEVNKKDRIGFSMERINGRPTMRIENADYFYGQTSAITFPDAKEVVMQMDTSQLYSQVHLGSSITDDASPLVGQFPETISFVGFKDETFHIVGTCNVDRTLELNSEWIISSNIIEDIFVNGVDAYDDDIILVDVTLGTPNQATQSNWLNIGTAVFYNETFRNEATVERWLSGIPNTIASFLGNADDTFLAELTADTSPFTATILLASTDCQFDDDYTSPNHDVNNNYGNGTTQGNPVSLVNSRYTAPASGAYSFTANVLVNITGRCGFILQARAYDNLNNPLNSIGTSYNNLTGNQTLTVSGILNLTAAYYVIVSLLYIKSNSSIATTFIIKSGSTFECTASDTGGGIYETIDPADYKIKKYSFKYPMTYDDLNTIKADTKKLITFTTNNAVQQTGWIETIKYFHHNKAAEIVLITN